MANKERVVLMAMDGSKYAEYAFDWYVEQIHRNEDKVILLNVVELHQFTTYPMGLGDISAVTEMIEEEKVKAKEYLETLTSKMRASGLHGKVKQVYGRARDEILRVADEEKVTFIVTGTRGMGKVRRTLLGSVSGHVLHHTHVPVFVCRHKDDHHNLPHHGKDHS